MITFNMRTMQYFTGWINRVAQIFKVKKVKQNKSRLRSSLRIVYDRYAFLVIASYGVFLKLC